ncbi:MAG: hypothetical protein ABID87_03665 [Chloroflexota bacterium]
MEYSSESAALLFTASTVMIVISLMLISSAWKSLKEIIAVLPPEKRRIYPLFRVKELDDEVERDKEIYKNCLWLASFILGANVFVNIASLGGIAGLFLGIHIGFEEVAKENFNWARYTLFASPLLLAFAVVLLGGYRFMEFKAMKAGRFDPERWRQTKESVNQLIQDNALKEGNPEQESTENRH